MTKNEVDKAIYGRGVDSFNRFDVFLELIPFLKGKTYWYALANAYTDSDNLFGQSESIKDAFLKQETNRDTLMTADENDYLKTLPKQIKIFRGMTNVELENGKFGYSWTTKKHIAEYFAFEYKRNYDTCGISKLVHEITISKEDVIAFFNSRSEYEIIYIQR